MYTCSHCGANLSPYDQTCSYCGAANPDYREPAPSLNALLAEAVQAFRREDYANAIAACEKIIAQDRQLFDAYFYLAASFQALGLTEKAIAAMEQARDIRPGNAPIYYNLAILFRKAGRDDAAVRRCLEEALARAENMSPDFRRRVETELKRLQKKRWPWQR